MRIGFDVGGGTDGSAWPFPWAAPVTSGAGSVTDVHSGKLRISMPNTASVIVSMMYQRPVNFYRWEIGVRVTPSVAWNVPTCRLYFGVTSTNALDVNGLVSDSIFAQVPAFGGSGIGSVQQEASSTLLGLTPNNSSTVAQTTAPMLLRVRLVFPHPMLKIWSEGTVEPPWYQEPSATYVPPTLAPVKPMFPFVLVNNNNAVARDYSFDQFYFDDLQPRHASLNLA